MPPPTAVGLPFAVPAASAACTLGDECPRHFLSLSYPLLLKAPQGSGEEHVPGPQRTLPGNENNSSEMEHFAAFLCTLLLCLSRTTTVVTSEPKWKDCEL